MKHTGRIVGVLLPFTFNLFFFLNSNDIPISSASIYLLFILNGVVGYFFGLQFDKYMFSKRELNDSKLSLKEYADAIKSTMDGVAILNEVGEYQFFNQSFLNIYRYEDGELLGKAWQVVYKEEELPWIEQNILVALNTNDFWQGELIGLRKDGTTFPQEATLSKIKETNGFVVVVRDISEKKAAEEYIKQMATQNELTNLPNRRLLLDQLNTYIDNDKKFAVLFMDLDRFKMTNDTLGHSVGDQLLKEVASRLLSFKNDRTSIYHLGGDEFIVVLLDYLNDEVNNLAEKVIQAIDKVYVIDEFEVYITTSIGISLHPDSTNNAEKIISLADTAMYNAKLKGKNTYQLYNAEINEQLHRRVNIERELRYAVEKNELSLNYQPKFNLQNNKVIGMEALLRWDNSTLGRVSPIEFIPIAEETGMINSIGLWVIKQAITQMKLWEKQGFTNLKVSVNLSLIQLRHRHFVDSISTTLRQSGIDPALFELEITESMMESVEEILPTLEKIKQLGVGISIDDFGTGFSSLSYLKRLPIDTIKIDRSFIFDLVQDSSDVAIVKSILDIGTNLQLSVVAEGIETEEHLRLLKDLGCPIGQGYYFSPPVPVEKIEELYLK
ncbi:MULTISPECIES: putative bifunctional diguanylate cyclase/phosphodiesterase [Bacillaceae]|uniref:EAL domain-containing protein n=1 Tax=Evansella alkalicola TaxID=745819 RepID=A0ABS6JN94_9BACI|nr:MULTISPECIES: GGDEF and EAL domain-containing protein [Bacillaceae]MBU9719890.1 EAL domain-containing protein [Bacillus alkalicola]